MADIKTGITDFETEFIDQLKRRNIPCICVLNKSDKIQLTKKELEEIQKLVKIPVVCASAYKKTGIDEIKKQIIANSD